MFDYNGPVDFEQFPSFKQSQKPTTGADTWKKFLEDRKKKKKDNQSTIPNFNEVLENPKPPLQDLIQDVSTISSGDDFKNYIRWLAAQDRFKEMSQF